MAQQKKGKLFLKPHLIVLLLVFLTASVVYSLYLKKHAKPAVYNFPHAFAYLSNGQFYIYNLDSDRTIKLPITGDSSSMLPDWVTGNNFFISKFNSPTTIEYYLANGIVGSIKKVSFPVFDYYTRSNDGKSLNTEVITQNGKPIFLYQGDLSYLNDTKDPTQTKYYSYRFDGTHTEISKQEYFNNTEKINAPISPSGRYSFSSTIKLPSAGKYANGILDTQTDKGYPVSGGFVDLGLSPGEDKVALLDYSNNPNYYLKVFSLSDLEDQKTDRPLLSINSGHYFQWLDNNRILVETFSNASNPDMFTGFYSSEISIYNLSDGTKQVIIPSFKGFEIDDLAMSSDEKRLSYGVIKVTPTGESTGTEKREIVVYSMDQKKIIGTIPYEIATMSDPYIK